MISTLGPLLILAILAAWFASINFGAIFHLASRATSPESVATLIGFVNFLANLGAIFFTLIFGWIKDTTGSFSWGFCVLASLCLSAFLLGRIPLQNAADAK
jgi:nitrate/nitrite transporter NarK